MTFRAILLIVILAAAVALAHHLDGRAVRTRGVVLPQMEWKLMATQDGVVEHLQRNGVTMMSRGWQGVRGDPIAVSLIRHPEAGDMIRAGQSIAAVVFPLESHGATTTRARLEGARAELRLLLAGPRPEEVSAATARAQSAMLSAALRATEASRACSLAARTWISQEEYERTEAEAGVARADAEAAQAELDLLVAGARDEELNAARAEIAALEAEAEEAMERAETTIVFAPIDAVVGDPLPECLIVLQKTDTVLVAVPLDQRVWHTVQPGDMVEITDHRRLKSSGTIERLGQTASVVGGTVSMAAYATVPNSELRLRAGMTVGTSIRTRSP